MFASVRAISSLFSNQVLRTSAIATTSTTSLFARSFQSSQPALEFTEAHKQTIKATAPVLAEHGYTITKTMYKNMFAKHPFVKTLFNQGHQVEQNGEKAHQPLTLACAVHAYAANIDNLAALGPAVERMAQKHVSLNILPEQYDIVGTELLGAIKEVLGDAANEQIMESWKEGYGFLAEILIQRENAIRKAAAAIEGGWEHLRDFTVTDIANESDSIKSFVLKPVDGGIVPRWIPGQYAGIRITLPNGEETQRNYTLSCPSNNDHFQFSIKRQGPQTEGGPDGIVSTFFHDNVKVGDTIKVSPPCGEFFNENNHQDGANKPIVLISGGVGITPIPSIVDWVVQKKPTTPVYAMFAWKNEEGEAMHDKMLADANKYLNLNVKFVYDTPPAGGIKGPLTIQHIKTFVPLKDAHYYVCGPPGFMKSVITSLAAEGIHHNQVHYEYFGPHEVIES